MRTVGTPSCNRSEVSFPMAKKPATPDATLSAPVKKSFPAAPSRAAKAKTKAAPAKAVPDLPPSSAGLDSLGQALAELRARFLGTQSPEGWWVFDLEADVTITAEYILYHRFMGQTMDQGLKTRLCAHLLAKQASDGG